MTGWQSGRKRRTSEAQLKVLQNARKKKKANLDVKKSKDAQKQQLLKRKEKLNKMRRGKPYSLLVWAILFVGIMNLLLGEYSNSI